MQIQEPMPKRADGTTMTPFEWMGGEPVVRALTDRFYDLMDLEPRFATLRGVHGSTLDNARDRLFWFLCGWLGGPQHYIERFGHPRLRARHLPFAIGVEERDQWLACMAQAMQDTGLPGGLQAFLNQQLYGTADWMRNQPEAPAAPVAGEGSGTT
jgi:hemoglobin